MVGNPLEVWGPHDGLDARFYRFVVQTMAWTIAVGFSGLAIFAALFVDEYRMGQVLLFTFAGASIACVFAFISYLAWIRPSGFIFRSVFQRLRRSRTETVAAMVAGTITTLAASLLFFIITVLGAWDFDSAFAAIILLGPLSLIVAPIVAWQNYREDPAERLPPKI